MRSSLTKFSVACGCLLLLCQAALAGPDTEDIFDLKMRISPRNNVRCFDTITVFIQFQNTTGATLNDFLIQAFFPNETQRYCSLRRIIYAPRDTTTTKTDFLRQNNVAFNFSSLQAGRQDSIIFSLDIIKPPAQSIFFTYTAIARARGVSTSEVGVFHTFAPGGCTGTSGAPNLGISKSRDKSSASVGDSVTFYLHVSNSSAFPAFNLVVEDSIPAGFTVDFIHLSHPLYSQEVLSNGIQVLRWVLPGAFAPGQRDTIIIPTRVEINPDIPKQLTNRCTIDNANRDLDYTNNEDTVSVRIVPRYDLKLDFTEAREKNIDPNVEETYTLAITNRSTRPVTNFNLYLAIDDGSASSDLYTIPFNGISHGGVAPDNATVRWLITKIDSGEVINRTLRLIYDRVGTGNPGRCVNFAARVDTVFDVLNTKQPDLNPADNKDNWRRCLNDVFDLVLEPTLDNNKPAAAVNQPQTYRLEFTNRSLLTLPAFTLRAELQPTAATTAGNINITNVSQGGATNGLQIIWTIPSLGPNVTDSRTFEATITGINAGGTFGFTLRGQVPVFAGESDTTNNRRTWETRASVVTNLVVVDVAATPAQAAINGTAQIRIDYANRGSLNKDNPVLRAIISVTPNAQIFSISNSGGGISDASNRLITWTIPSLPANTSGSRLFDLRFDNVTQAANYNIKILGVIDRHDAADPVADNRDSVTVGLTALPQLFLSDIGLTGRLENDQTLIYTFTYGNTGTFVATNATLELNMPQATMEWTDAGGRTLSQATRLELGDLAPGFQAPMTVRMKIINRENLLRQFGNRVVVDLSFSATLTATNAPPPISKSRTDQLTVPKLVEGFFLTRNRFQPETQSEVEIHFDVIKDANVGFKIYNVAGELVRSLAPKFGVLGSRVRQFWDGRNDTGERVASGLYFIFAEVDYKSERPYRKLIVVR